MKNLKLSIIIIFFHFVGFIFGLAIGVQIMVDAFPCVEEEVKKTKQRKEEYEPLEYRMEMAYFNAQIDLLSGDTLIDNFGPARGYMWKNPHDRRYRPYFGDEVNNWYKKVDFTGNRIDYAIFKGQKDALEGKVVVAKNDDGAYYWIGSPWDSKKKPTYSPSYFIDKKGDLIYFE